MAEIVNDISTLATVKKSDLERLIDLTEDVICHKIFETKSADQNVTTYDIGFGKLMFEYLNDELRYKFVPSKKFEKKIIKTFDNNEDLLAIRVENRLEQKILSTYKELM